MATAFVDQITGQGETVAYKAPCRVATTSAITLAGLLTIDGVVLVANDRVLVKDQADQKTNGIYIASTAGWTRARDWDGNRDVTKGTRITVTDGTVNGGREYLLTSANPVTIGSSNITFTESLSSNAGGSAAAAAASASAAAGSASAAATSETNAANSATAANTSKNNAATSETNAGNSATAAAGSASSASTSATNAGNSATSAGTSATNAGNSATAAAGSATTASTAATNAGNSATAAAASASAAATAAQAMPYTFSTTTADTDPGNGVFRLNNATIASATAAYVDNQDSDGTNQTGNLDTFDDSTNTIKGKLTVRSRTTAATKHVFNVTGSVVDGTGYRKLTLAYVGGAGTLSNAEACWLEFSRSGDKGVDGAGAGDFTGPASSVTDNIVTFASTTGKAGKDSGVAVSSLAPKASPALTGTPTAPTATAGTNSTQIATTAYVDTTFAPKASPTLTGTPAAPTASVGTNTTQIATTAFVKAAIDVVLGGVASAFDTLSEIAAAMMQKAADNLGLTAGFTSVVVDDGTKSSGTYTPAPTGGNYRKITANGAFTLAAPTTANSYNMTIDITNGASAGTITFSGFVAGHPKGDAYATTNAAKFKLHISKTDAGVTAILEAL